MERMHALQTSIQTMHFLVPRATGFLILGSVVRFQMISGERSSCVPALYSAKIGDF